MQVWIALCLCWLLMSCQGAEPPPPPLAPMPEDLSVWATPLQVYPTAQTPRQVPVRIPAGTAEKVVDYGIGMAVEVPVALGAPLDIVLEAGEQVRQIVDGDRAPAEQGQTRRWEVREGGDGSGERLRPHVFVTAAEAGLTNGLTITTTRRTYYLTCKSVGKSPVRVLRWHYPLDPHATPPVETPPGVLPHPEQPQQYHVGYTVVAQTRPAPTWTPRQVVDDGKKLYLLYPEVTLFGTVPLVRLLGTGGPQVLNARQYLNVLILDQLLLDQRAPALELRVGTGDSAEVVTITRGTGLRTITCPDDGADCPQWPGAAPSLTMRSPR